MISVKIFSPIKLDPILSPQQKIPSFYNALISIYLLINKNEIISFVCLCLIMCILTKTKISESYFDSKKFLSQLEK